MFDRNTYSKKQRVCREGRRRETEVFVPRHFQWPWPLRLERRLPNYETGRWLLCLKCFVVSPVQQKSDRFVENTMGELVMCSLVDAGDEDVWHELLVPVDSEQLSSRGEYQEEPSFSWW